MATSGTGHSVRRPYRLGWQRNLDLDRTWIKAHAPRLLALLLVLSWGGRLIQDSYSVYARLGETAFPTTPAAPAPSDKKIHFEITRATGLHLFGKINTAPVAELDTTSLPDTSANLSLVGLFASTHPGTSSSLIAAQGDVAKSYREGDELPGGVILHQIEANGIILKRGDQFERLLLAKSAIGPTPKPAPSIEELVPLSRPSSAPESSAPLSDDPRRRPSDIFHALDAKLAALREHQK